MGIGALVGQGGSSSPIVLSKALTADASIVANVETVAFSTTIPANFLAVGDRIVASMKGVSTGTDAAASPVARLRIGPTTLTGNSRSQSGPLNQSAVYRQEWVFEAIVRAIGSSGSLRAISLFSSTLEITASSPTGGIGPAPASIAVDTTVSNLIELTLLTSSASVSFTIGLASITIHRQTA